MLKEAAEARHKAGGLDAFRVAGYTCGQRGSIDSAAAKLMAVSYPLRQCIDGASCLYTKPLLCASPVAVDRPGLKGMPSGPPPSSSES